MTREELETWAKDTIDVYHGLARRTPQPRHHCRPLWLQYRKSSSRTG